MPWGDQFAIDLGLDPEVFSQKMDYFLNSHQRNLWVEVGPLNIYLVKWRTPEGIYLGSGNISIATEAQNKGLCQLVVGMMVGTAQAHSLLGAMFYTVQNPALVHILNKCGFVENLLDGQGSFFLDFRTWVPPAFG